MQIFDYYDFNDEETKQKFTDNKKKINIYVNTKSKIS